MNLLLLRMQHGGTSSNSPRRDRRRDNVLLQKEPNGGGNRLRRAHRQHTHYKGGRGGGGDSNEENLPLADFVERSLLTRGPSRRTHSIRVLETRYPQKNGEDAAEPQERSARQSKNNASQSPRSFRGNQSLANACGATEEKASRAKKKCGHHRRVAHDSRSSRIFQALGNDLLLEFLTPREVYNIEIAFEWDFDWGRAWHGGKVKNKAVAAHIQFDLQQGLQAEQLLAKYNRDLAFSALWYLVDSVEIQRLAEKYKHYKTMRKICRFLC